MYKLAEGRCGSENLPKSSTFNLSCSFSLNQFAAAADTLKGSASFWRLHELSHTLRDTSVHRILGNGKINLAETSGNSWSDVDRRWPHIDLKTAGSERTQPLNSPLHCLPERNLPLIFVIWLIFIHSVSPQKEENGQVKSTVPSSQNQFVQSGLGPGQEYEIAINMIKNNTRGPQSKKKVTTSEFQAPTKQLLET